MKRWTRPSHPEVSLEAGTTGPMGHLALGLLLAAMTAPQDEPLRPQFHFTAQSGWLNDPNGLVFFKGEYHLFFQHNPFGTQWGNMTWGHAVSKDLFHWQQVENAIAPDSLGTIFSGSAVVDPRGRAITCIYTAAGGTNEASKNEPFTQCIATSTDGRKFTKFASNPVLGHLAGENRDPKVIWHEPTKSYVMALYLEGDRYALFRSDRLTAWIKLCDVMMPGTSECPDFFPLKVEGGKGTKWVFSGANGRYRVGTFDGRQFKPETDPLPSNFGNTGYAAQTYFNDPKGRRVQIAWLNNSNFPDCAWNQQMGVPTELKLVATPQGPRLSILPVEEIKTLRLKRAELADGVYSPNNGLLDIAVRFKAPSAGSLVLDVNGHEVTFDASTSKLRIGDREALLEKRDGGFDLRVVADRASIEVFAQGGLVTMPMFLLPTGKTGLRVKSDFKLETIEVYPLKSARGSKSM
ncbi:MAG: glycoside hydrolase family 32 protein [Armatimonadetes bacterium]|nr:glycoside hydrolase family 32 protein [Armatimonadota bacterium]